MSILVVINEMTQPPGWEEYWELNKDRIVELRCRKKPLPWSKIAEVISKDNFQPSRGQVQNKVTHWGLQALTKQEIDKLPNKTASGNFQSTSETYYSTSHYEHPGHYRLPPIPGLMLPNNGATPSHEVEHMQMNNIPSPFSEAAERSVPFSAFSQPSTPYNTVPDNRFNRVSTHPLPIPYDTTSDYRIENAATGPFSNTYYEESGSKNSYMDISSTPYGSNPHQNTVTGVPMNRLPGSYRVEPSYTDPVMMTNFSSVPYSVDNGTADLHDDDSKEDKNIKSTCVLL